MPTLNWIGKEKVINHHRDVPFRVLEHQYGFKGNAKTGKSNESETPTGSGNKIIYGDNLEALKSLLSEYEGKIKCIYIDPPYNTGNENWVYNDNVNHPKIKKWLGEVVGKEGDDLTRHDKWLCMMYPRLQLLHQLLSDDGAIFISIDDNEQANLKLICDEIFGSSNAIGPIIHNKLNSKNDTIDIQKNHEFILVYKKKNKLSISETPSTLINMVYEDKKVFKENERYYFINDSITTRGEGGTLNARPNLGYTVYYNPETNEKIAKEDYDVELAKTSNDLKKIYTTNKNLVSKGFKVIRPPKVRGQLGCWTWSKEKFNLENDDIVVTTGRGGALRLKKRTFVNSEKVIEKNNTLYYRTQHKRNSRSILEFSTNEGTKTLNNILGKSNVFDNPKNINLLKYLIGLIPNKDCIILDSFAGSGTTAHAVLNLNKEDGGNRKFILIEMEDYANDITAERVKRVANGYGTGNKTVEGTGGSFDFYKLGKPLFDENDNLNEEVGLEKIQEYIWFSETRTPATFIQQYSEAEPYLLGKKEDTAYYFIYEKERLTTLDYDALEHIKTKAQQYVIYADNCLLPRVFMSKHNIVFKKIPRDITRF